MSDCKHEDQAQERSVCSACGEQDAYCTFCFADMCGCWSPDAPSDDARNDLESPSSTPVDSSATESLEGSQISDPVNSPAHYSRHPSGIECIQVVEHMGFNLGNAVKYIWRCDLKRDAIEDLEKSVWYLTREIEKRKRERDTP